jgi:predicted amidohydrolase
LNKLGNVERVRRLTRRVEADLVILPEYSMFPPDGLSPEEVYALSEGLDGPFVEEFTRFAEEYSTYVLVPILERSGAPPRVYNTSVLISPRGTAVATYRKLHLMDALGVRESSYVVPGDRPSPVVEVAGARVAVAVCFDLRFPELFRLYALAGAEVIAVPAAWYRGPLKEEVLHTLARARSIENTVYVAVANQFSDRFTGRSAAVDPMGVVLADLGVGERYAEVVLDLDYLGEVRRQLPLLDLRRVDVYELRPLKTPPTQP